MRNLGKGDKATVSGDPIDMGLSDRESYKHDQELRGKTDDKTQRPVGKTESVSSDRGTFKIKR